MEFLKAVRLGIQYRYLFSYDEYEVTLRPLTTMEINDAKFKAYGIVSSKVAEIIVSMKLGRLDPKSEVELKPEMFVNISKFNAEMEYWLVYHSMKDFMPNDFSIEDVRKMKYVHNMATIVLRISSANEKTIYDYIYSADGKELAKVIYQFKVPITDAAWKLTPLQHDFLVYSDPTAPKRVGETMDDLDSVMMRLGEML